MVQNTSGTSNFEQSGGSVSPDHSIGTPSPSPDTATALDSPAQCDSVVHSPTSDYLDSDVEPTLFDGGNQDSQEKIFSDDGHDDILLADDRDDQLEDLEKPRRKLTRSDANSIVGGSLINDWSIDHKDQATIPEEESLSKQDAFSKPTTTFLSRFTPSLLQKVFPFSLPFGGLSSIRRHFFDAKSDPPPPSQRATPPNLPRSNSMNTIQEAIYYKNYKYDDARMKAVRKSLAQSVNEMVPLILSRKQKPWNQSFADLLGNVLLMGGYRGLVLRDAKTRKRLWIPIKAGLNLRKVDLLLGPNLEDELKAHETIVADGILSNVGPMDICKRLIKRFTMNSNVRFFNWGYDWRLSGDILAQKLERKLENIYKATGEGTIVLCHSMGGLVTQGVVQRRPELFRGIIFIGCPSECLNILGPIRFGDSVGFLDKILTPECNFMMRLSFLFLPLSGQVFVDKDTYKRYDLDLFNPDTWVEYNLNPLVACNRIESNQIKTSNILPLALQVQKSDSSFSLTDLILLNNISSRLKLLKKRAESFGSRGSSNHEEEEMDADDLEYSITFDQAYEYLSRELKRTKEYILGLEFKPELERKYPPMAIVYGNQVPLVRGSYVPGEDGIKDGDYYNFYYGRGDGVVHQKWLMPESKGFDFYDPDKDTGHIVGKFPSSCGHVSLMTDLEAIGNAISLITDAEPIWARRRKDKNEISPSTSKPTPA